MTNFGTQACCEAIANLNVAGGTIIAGGEGVVAELAAGVDVEGDAGDSEAGLRLELQRSEC